MNAATLDGILAFSSGLGLASLLLYCLTIDRIVRLLHDDHRKDWIALGQPVGIFYLPESTDWTRGMAAQLGLVCDVLFKTPQWLAENPELLFLIKKIRWCIALAVLSLITGILLR
ncbi:MAG: hypothetical protein ABW346_08245 [Terrimicrobium sp.]